MSMQLVRPEHDYIEIFLHPGEWYFGDCNTRLRTLLGSCVAVTMWHPRLCVGAMCHFLLPTRSTDDSGPIANLDGRYGDEVLPRLLQEAVAHDTNPADYTVKVFGGGNMFAARAQGNTGDVGNRNVARAEQLLRIFGFTIAAAHVRDVGHRTIVFDVWSGHVWVKHVRQAVHAAS